MKRRTTGFVILKLHHDTFRVDRTRILRAMKEFDRKYRVKEPIAGTKFAVIHDGQIYPPKRVLGLAIGQSISTFSGGRFTNDVFCQLGFCVGDAPPRPDRSKAELNGPIPTVGEVLSRLFSGKWTKLDPDLEISAREGGEYPGIYAIAYSDENLEGRRVDERDIFYIGMSNHAGLKNRLAQFVLGLEDGSHHSAAMRFFKKLAQGKRYSQLNPRKDFFFVWAPVPCVTAKRERKPRDLRKMGIVAAAELYALARTRQKTGREPELNKQ